MLIKECDTIDKFKQFLHDLEGDIDDVSFQSIVAAALRFGLDPNFFGGVSGGGPFGNGGHSSFSGIDTTARRYARGKSAPARSLYPILVGEIKKVFEAP